MGKSHLGECMLACVISGAMGVARHMGMRVRRSAQGALCQGTERSTMHGLHGDDAL